MAKNDFTDARVRALLPKDALYRIHDTEVRGLGLSVYPTGCKVWNWKGRTKDGVKTYTLGSHPAYDVQKAREFASAIILEKERGNEPVIGGSDLPLAPAIVDWAFERYMEQEGGQRKSAAEKWRIYRKDIQPALGSKSLYKVRYDDVATIALAKFEIAPVMSNNIVALLKRFFRWCVTKGRPVTKLEVDPSQHLVNSNVRTKESDT